LSHGESFDPDCGKPRLSQARHLDGRGNETGQRHGRPLTRRARRYFFAGGVPPTGGATTAREGLLDAAALASEMAFSSRQRT